MTDLVADVWVGRQFEMDFSSVFACSGLQFLIPGVCWRASKLVRQIKMLRTNLGLILAKNPNGPSWKEGRTLNPVLLEWATLAAVIVSALTLGVTAAQGRRRNRERIEGRLDALQVQINAVATDVAKIFGWLEGQRDQRISRPDIPTQ